MTATIKEMFAAISPVSPRAGDSPPPLALFSSLTLEDNQLRSEPLLDSQWVLDSQSLWYSERPWGTFPDY